MTTRKKDEFIQATLESENLLSKLAIVPNGHYARITEAGTEKIVIVYTNKTQLVNGSFLISKFAESDQAQRHMRHLTKEHQPADLGDYTTFMHAHQETWHVVLKSPNCPPPGLRMVQAVDYLVQRNTPIDEQAINAGLEEFGRIPQAAVYDLAEQRLNDKLLSHA